MKSAHRNIAPYLSFLLALSAWVYAVYCARTLSITHDEALTYPIFASRPFLDLFKPEVIGMNANNHLLNTVLAAISVRFLGLSELAMRIPALIGAACYIFAAILIAHGLFRGLAATGAAIFLLANPYVLDFLPLARGYSLALGLSMLGIWLLLLRVRRIERPGLRLVFCSAALFGLAPFANLAYLNLCLAGWCCLLGVEWRHALSLRYSGTSRNRGDSIRHLLRTACVCLPSAALLLLVYWRPVALLRKNNQFFIGGTSGFVPDTMNSLLHNWLYAPAFDKLNLLPLAWVLMLLLCLSGPATLLLARRQGKLKKYFVEFLPWAWLLCVVPILESVTQRFLLGTHYLLDRTALFYMPLFTILALSLLSSFNAPGLLAPTTGKQRWSSRLLACCAGIALCHTLLVSTPGATREWRYSACVTSQMKYLAGMAYEAISRGMLEPPVTMGTDYKFGPSVIFFINQYRLDWLRWHLTSSPENNFPLYLEFTRNAQPFLQAGFNECCPCETSGSAIYYRLPQQVR